MRRASCAPAQSMREDARRFVGRVVEPTANVPARVARNPSRVRDLLRTRVMATTAVRSSFTVDAPARRTSQPPRTPRVKRGWSWRIGSVTGIDLNLHATFLLLLVWVALTHWLQRHDALDALGGVLLILSVFGIVVLHELGHALVARRFGIRTFDITLLPIGGVARLERMPDNPKQEMLVALAGPAVNVVLALLCFVGVVLLGGSLDPSAISVASGAIVAKLMWINVAIAVFNMLPAFPMDGGRVFRALLAMRMSHVQATDYAARVGQTLAFGLGAVGLFFNPFLVVAALFVWMGAREEAAMEHVRFSLHGITVGEAMTTRFRALAPHDTVAEVADEALSGFQEDFPVVDAGDVVGVLARTELLRALARGAREARVGDIMDRELAMADVSEPLLQATQRLDPETTRAMPVLERGVLVGLLTPRRIGEIVMTRV